MDNLEQIEQTFRNLIYDNLEELTFNSKYGNDYDSDKYRIPKELYDKLNNIGILEQIVLENATQPLRRTNKKYLKKLNQYNSDIAIETINLLHQSNNTILNVNKLLTTVR